MSIEARHPRLGLNWIGKDSTPRLEPRVLLEDSELSYSVSTASGTSPGTPNLLIQADNLLSLRALESEFLGAVKCVCIDPPYNTGAAFAQYDDGIEHSLWLTFMRDRLAILWRLLSASGSLWITIDDHEAHYLKVLCDELFGRQSFVANVVWQKKYTVANDARWLSDNHDHILIYCKDPLTWRPNRLPRTDAMNARYRNPDNHPKGPWKATPLHAKSGSEKGATFKYTFRNGVTWSPPPGTFPRFSAETLARMDEGNEIWFGADGKNTPSRKTFLSEIGEDGVVAQTIWSHDEVGHNHEAKTEAKAFNQADVFATPKPERLIQRILTIATSPGDLVLDSFLGSGTTAAVAHKMGRRWIGIELGDHAITHCVPRLRKVIDGQDPGGITDAVGWAGGGGFRFLRLAPSLLQQDHWGNWVINKTYRAEMLAEAMCKIEGFRYAPSQAQFWQHGQSTERDFIYVTTQALTQEQFVVLADEVGPDRTLLICCTAFRAKPEAFSNLTIKKIPATVLARCEWGRDDYSLNVESIVVSAPPSTPETVALSASMPAQARRGRKPAPVVLEQPVLPLGDGDTD